MSGAIGTEKIIYCDEIASPTTQARNDKDCPCESQAERNDTPCDGERSQYYFFLMICNENKG